MADLPLMGIGTFIGIEDKPITDRDQRYQITKATIMTALDLGYRHLDLAECYQNLPAVKAALHQAFKPIDARGLGIPRSEVFVTMKADPPFNSGHINSLLETVGLDYFDAFLAHHPEALFDSESSLVNHWTMLNVMHGCKLHNIGVSNCYQPHMERLLAICASYNLIPPFANEIEINPMSQNTELVQFCKLHDIKPIAYSPLGYAYSGFLLEDKTMLRIADELGATVFQVALAWNMKQGVAVIPKSVNPERLQENFDASDLVNKLSPEHMQAISKLIPVVPATFGTAEDAIAHAKQLNWDVCVITDATRVLSANVHSMFSVEVPGRRDTSISSQVLESQAPAIKADDADEKPGGCQIV